MFQDNTDNNFAAIHHKNDLILTYYWQRCIITEKNGFAFKYYWQVGYIPDKSDEMRVGLLTEIFWGRQVWTRNQVSPGSNLPLLAFRRLGIFVLSIDALVDSAV